MKSGKKEDAGAAAPGVIFDEAGIGGGALGFGFSYPASQDENLVAAAMAAHSFENDPGRAQDGDYQGVCCYRGRIVMPGRAL